MPAETVTNVLCCLDLMQAICYLTYLGNLSYQRQPENTRTHEQLLQRFEIEPNVNI